MTRSSLSMFTAGAVVALVLGSGTAVAATGGKFVLGRTNTETSPSTLSNTKGTALALKSRAGTPPFTVNSSTKVPSLDSDRLDDLDSSAFALTRGQTAALDVPGQPIDLDVKPDGVYDAVVAIARCPTGTKLTGGGVTDSTDTGQIWSSAPDPDLADSWTVVVGIDGANEQHATDVLATAVCYNPRGPVPNAAVSGSRARTGDPLSRLPADRVAQLRTRAEARSR